MFWCCRFIFFIFKVVENAFKLGFSFSTIKNQKDLSFSLWYFLIDFIDLLFSCIDFCLGLELTVPLPDKTSHECAVGGGTGKSRCIIIRPVSLWGVKQSGREWHTGCRREGGRHVMHWITTSVCVWETDAAATLQNTEFLIQLFKRFRNFPTRSFVSTLLRGKMSSK